ncbi:hypothetical protein BDZ89DRAFT_1068792 [Hymenopellis radicata]|nr:hypothetical protein BDZ89DRAFT_1068792 [Hymenopellis radicata]
MGRLNLTDVRGGNGDDSSSSRESSPRPLAQRRLPSPNFDDDADVEVPPIADDDTPPPETRPLIREPMAFTQTVTAPPNVDTYKAQPATQLEKNISLPGQKVTVPKKKKETRSKKTKHSSNFPNQVGRFRLQSYDPTSGPSTPPIQSGTGPYSSMYRATTAPFNPQEPVAPAYPTMPPAPPKKTRGKSASKSPHPFTQFSVTNPPSPPQPPPSSAAFRSSGDPMYPPIPAPAGHHYRRDYDKDPFGIGQVTHGRRDSDATMSSSHSPSSSNRQPVDQKPRVPSRMVTILIIDIRSGQQDHQLAEIKIPLKPADNPDDGFWADAKELCSKLQEGPSRIDGPAKVYTMRGRYRQFFLRVSEDNKDETMPANLSITPDRTIEVVVEVGQRPGEIPGPPRIPEELRSFSPPPDDMMDPRHGRYSNHMSDPNLDYNKKRRHSPTGDYHYEPPPPHASGSRPYPASQVAFSPTYPPNASPYHPAVALTSPPPPPKKIRGYEPEPLRTTEPPTSPGHELPKQTLPIIGPLADFRARQRDPLQMSPEPEDEPEVVYKKIIKRVDRLIQKEIGWPEWFKHRGQPQCVPVVLVLYRFAQYLFDLYEGKRVPFTSPTVDHTITRGYILAALLMNEDEEPAKFAADCSETLDLLALYGPEGKRLQDERVKDMMEDKSPPAYNAKPVKRFLRLLREIDEEWTKAHSDDKEGSGESASSPDVVMTEHTPTP